MRTLGVTAVATLTLVVLTGCATEGTVNRGDLLIEAVSEIDGVSLSDSAPEVEFRDARGALAVSIEADSWDTFRAVVTDVVDAWDDSSMSTERAFFLILSTAGGESYFQWQNVDTGDLDPYLAATRIWYDLETATDTPALDTGSGSNFIRGTEFGIHAYVENQELGEAAVVEIQQAATEAGLVFRPGGITATEPGLVD